jgi:hypothetical protein
MLIEELWVGVADTFEGIVEWAREHKDLKLPPRLEAALKVHHSLGCRQFKRGRTYRAR